MSEKSEILRLRDAAVLAHARDRGSATVASVCAALNIKGELARLSLGRLKGQGDVTREWVSVGPHSHYVYWATP